MKIRVFCLISLALLVNSSFAYTILLPQRHWLAIANQLDQGGNTLDEVLPDVPAGTILSKWDCATQDYGTPYTFNERTLKWSPEGGTLVPGEGVERVQVPLWVYKKTAKMPDLNFRNVGNI